MGFAGLNTNFLGNINWGVISAWAGIIFVFVVFLIIAGVIAYFYYGKKSLDQQFKNKIPLFLKIHGKLSRIDVENAKEVFIPDSNIGLFYLRKRKIYIARPTRSMGKDEFWYYISANGEWVNFDLSEDPENNTLALANYDHRDTRYAYVNLKDIIKRNYKDKTQEWWKEYSTLITFIIVSFIFVGACWILLAKIGTLIGSLGPFLDKLDIIADKMSGAVQVAQNMNSGVVSS